MQLKKAIRGDITISPSHNNGFIVKVGCGTFVFESATQLCSELAGYLNNPEKYQKEYESVYSTQDTALYPND